MEFWLSGSLGGSWIWSWIWCGVARLMEFHSGGKSASLFGMARTGRPPKEAPDKITSVLAGLDQHQVRCLDAMVAVHPKHKTKQDYIRALVRAEYIKCVEQGMTPVPRVDPAAKGAVS